MTVDAFRALLAGADLYVYERSVDESEGTAAALVRRDLANSWRWRGRRLTGLTGRRRAN